MSADMGCDFRHLHFIDAIILLTDMLEIPEKLTPLVSDYKMNLIEVRNSEPLRFHNQDVDTVFDVSRSIYERNFDKINTIINDIPCITDLQKDFYRVYIKARYDSILKPAFERILP